METYRELHTIVLLYMLILLVADCVCGVVGTSFCGANQPVVGWLGGQWFLEPTRVKVLVLAFILG